MATIPLNITTFRTNFSAFANVTTYPDALLNTQYVITSCYISNEDSGRLNGDCREIALQMMLAHVLTLNDKIASGANTGQVVSASEDGVSVSLTPPPDNSQFSWWLNTTPYGQQLNALLELYTVGGFYLGGLAEGSAFRKVGGVF